MLELTGEHIARLSDVDLRSLVRRLAEHELRRAGLPISGVLAGGDQRAADGGLDVKVELEAARDAKRLDFVPRAFTGFQVKREDIPPAKIAAEMRPGGTLRPAIVELIARSGAYIIVSSQGSVAESRLQERRKAMAAAVKAEDPRGQLKLDFYDRDRLAAWTRSCPGVELWVRDRVGATLQAWRPYGDWARHSASRRYVHDPAARMRRRPATQSSALMGTEQAVDELRRQLAQPGSVIRLVGLSGTGKTRLMQALFEPDVGKHPPLGASMVVYADMGLSPEPTAQQMLTHLGGRGLRAVVILDNCAPNVHRTLAEVAQSAAGCLSLATIEYDVGEDESELAQVFELVPASDSVIDQILVQQASHLSDPDRSRITQFSGGNARMALALAATVGPGQSLGTLTDSDLFERLFYQHQGDLRTQDSALMRAAEVCALVYSFDGHQKSRELVVLADLARLSVDELYRHVRTLANRQLVQERGRWRALLPHALANRLAKQALDNLRHDRISEAFEAHPRLLSSFSRRLELLPDSAQACALVREWLTHGCLRDVETLNEDRREIFCRVAPLVPDIVFGMLERATDGTAKPEFLTAGWGAWSAWIHLVRRLAYQPEHFARAVALLQRFASEDQDTDPDFREAWRELFHVVLSGTEAPPHQRLDVLQALFDSAQPGDQALAVAGLVAMLDAWHITSTHDFSTGARSQGYGWQPSTPRDVRTWYEGAIELLVKVARTHPHLRDELHLGFVQRFSELWSHAPIRDALLAAVLAVHRESKSVPAWAAVRVTRAQHAAEMDAAARSDLETLERQLAPHGLKEEIVAYVLAVPYGNLDPAEALFEDLDPGASDGMSSQQPLPHPRDRMSEQVRALGVRAAEDLNTLRDLLPTLLSAADGRQEAFGLGLGTAAKNSREVWTDLREVFAQLPETERRTPLLSGFLEGTRIQAPSEANRMLEDSVTDDVLGPHYPDLERDPVDDAAADRLLLALTHRRFDVRRLSLPGPLEGADSMSTDKFVQLLRAVAAEPGGVERSLQSLRMTLADAGGPKDARLVELGRDLLQRCEVDGDRSNWPYQLQVVAQHCLVGGEGRPAAMAFLKSFAHAVQLGGAHSDGHWALLKTLFELQPDASLDVFVSPANILNRFRFNTRMEVRHGQLLDAAEPAAVLQWVARAPQERAPLVAARIDMARLNAHGEPELSPLAQALITAVSNARPVLDAFAAHFDTLRSISSPGLRWADQRKLLQRLVAHAEPVVAAWAGDMDRKVAERSAKEGHQSRRIDSDSGAFE